MPVAAHESWSSGDAYEEYVGRWSRLLAPRFLRWAGLSGPIAVADIGCGTGALSQALLDAGAGRVVGIDRAADYVATAQLRLGSSRATFRVGDAQKLPLGDGDVDAAVSGLVVNFVPDPARMVAEMRRVVRPAGTVALYVWDYAGRMEFLRAFWDAAASLDPNARALDEGVRFPLCRDEGLADLFRAAGLADVETGTVDQPTVFRDFDDLWTPFLGGQGPAPGYCDTLDPGQLDRLRDRLRETLPIAPDGSISLVARALAVKGRVPS
jgi:SAM-dependent methyltransferase